MNQLKRINYWSKKYSRRAIQLTASHIYFDSDRDVRKSILVAGTGRSGTTWLADLIASQIPCRLLFEPFNPELVPDYHSFYYFQYMQPDKQDDDFYTFTRKVLTGEIRNRWIDHLNKRIFPKYRLIKEIRANLSLKWIHEKFPEVPILFLIRHPCAVVLSRMELGWATDSDIQPFLNQPDLITDHLADHLDLIKSSKTDEEKHAIIWAVSNLVPLEQFDPGELKIVYYENLCTQPETELARIFESVHHRIKYSMVRKKVGQPSLTVQSTSAVLTGADKIARWKNALNPTQIENIFRIVKAFGLDHLYADSLLPLNLTSTDHANK